MQRRGNRSGRISRRALVSAALSLGALGLASCSRDVAEAPNSPRVRLRVALDARPSALHGGLFQAMADGLYARRNLTVEPISGEVQPGAAQRLAAGTAELALGFDSQALLNLRSGGAPVRAVAAFFQKDPRALAVRGETPLTDLAALAPRPFAFEESDLAAFWPLIQARYGIAVDRLLSGDSALELFQATPDAVLAVDIGPELEAAARAAAQPLQWRLPAEEGFAGYGSLVIAPDGFARDNARALSAFIVATAEGWRDYLARDPAPAHGLISRAAPGVTAESLMAQRQRIIDAGLVLGGDAPVYGIGSMTLERWRDYVEAAAAVGAVATETDPADVFTVDFLPGRG